MENLDPNQPKNLFPKKAPPLTPPTNEENPPVEIEAWDRFFSKMTRKITRSANETDLLSPKEESENQRISQKDDIERPQIIKPKTERLNLRPAIDQPITSRFKPANASGGSSAPITSRYKPSLPSPSSPPITAKTTKLTSLINPTGQPRISFPQKEPVPIKEVSSLSHETLPSSSQKISAMPPSAEDVQNINLDAISLFHNNIPQEKPVSFEKNPPLSSSENQKSLFDRLDEIEAKQNIALLPEQKKVDSPVFFQKQLISPQIFLKYSLFDSQESKKDQIRCCSVCTQMMPDKKVFICERCQEHSCLKHRKGLFWCETCFSKINQFHPFFESIVEQLKAQEVKAKGESNGSLTSDELYSIFRTLSFVMSSEGLLVIGNNQFKRGICFLGNQILLVNFGTTNIISLGTLLKQSGLISEENIFFVLEYQKKHSLKFGEALVALNFLTKEVLAILLNEQIFREILAISRWPESNYKFRPGKVPPDTLQKMYIDTTVTLQDQSEFKQVLSIFFHHLTFIKIPGLLQLQSSAGSVSFLVHQNQFQLANFQPSERDAFGAYLVQAEILTLEQLEFAQQNSDSLKNYLIEQEILGTEQLQEFFQAYVGEELRKMLHDPQMGCHFYEGEASPKNLENLSILDVDLNLADLFYDMVARLEVIPPVLSLEEIFTLIFDKNSSEKIAEVLYQKIHQDLDFIEISPRFTVFEKAFIALVWVKSYIANYAKTLKQEKELLLQNNQASLAQLLLESLKHL